MKAPKWNDRLEQQRKARAINEIAYLTKAPKHVIEKEWEKQEAGDYDVPEDWKTITYTENGTGYWENLRVFNRMLTPDEINLITREAEGCTHITERGYVGWKKTAREAQRLQRLLESTVMF